MTKTPVGIAIYHEMRTGEGFPETAGMLWAMVRDVAARFPGAPRMLYVDIEDRGGREDAAEAAELISFTRAALGPFLTAATWGRTDESLPQSEQLPDVIVMIGRDGRPAVLTGDRERPVHDGPEAPPGIRQGPGATAAIYVRTGGAFAAEQEITT